MFDIINLNPEFQSQLGWIFTEAILHTDYQTEPEFHAFLRKLNDDWLIKRGLTTQTYNFPRGSRKIISGTVVSK